MMSQLTLAVVVVVAVLLVADGVGPAGADGLAGSDGPAEADGPGEEPSTRFEAVGPPPENATMTAMMTPSAIGIASGMARRENRFRPPRPRPALPCPVSI
jgi:hypothetical protein